MPKKYLRVQKSHLDPIVLFHGKGKLGGTARAGFCGLEGQRQPCSFEDMKNGGVLFKQWNRCQRTSPATPEELLMGSGDAGSCASQAAAPPGTRPPCQGQAPAQPLMPSSGRRGSSGIRLGVAQVEKTDGNRAHGYIWML
jgi:hypothetical protein